MLLVAIAIAIVASIQVMAGASPAYACKCAAPPNPETAYESAVTVFQGTVVSMEGVTPHGATTDDPESLDVLVEFRSTTVWKGPAPENISVTTPRQEASCGVTFLTGEVYVVYADSAPDLPLAHHHRHTVAAAPDRSPKPSRTSNGYASTRTR